MESFIDSGYATKSSATDQVVIGNAIYNKVSAADTFPSNLDFVVTRCSAMSAADANAEGVVKYTVLEVMNFL